MLLDAIDAGALALCVLMCFAIVLLGCGTIVELAAFEADFDFCKHHAATANGRRHPQSSGTPSPMELCPLFGVCGCRLISLARPTVGWLGQDHRWQLRMQL